MNALLPVDVLFIGLVPLSLLSISLSLRHFLRLTSFGKITENEPLIHCGAHNTISKKTDAIHNTECQLSSLPSLHPLLHSLLNSLSDPPNTCLPSRPPSKDLSFPQLRLHHSMLTPSNPTRHCHLLSAHSGSGSLKRAWSPRPVRFAPLMFQKASASSLGETLLKMKLS